MHLDSLLTDIDTSRGIPPVDQWHPEHAGEMDLLIAADGRWIHEGGVIQRARLVRLLSTILRRDPDGEYFLVTPVEKLRIRVEDRAFIAVDAEQDDSGDWQLVTQLGDWVRLDATHRLSVTPTPRGEWVPEVPIRFGLAARLGRNLFYRLVEQAEPFTDEQGVEWLALTSGGVTQPLGRVDGEAPCT
ncbi:DUF1285 domain-containing protein [Halomonas sabkhae]|uniref:DUF1285 domain-containing protein n=1 Tax=Halomonas sabkhae TaxID=626223 RepID=UPI0025B4A335|nr:DUF1285 domain-containing protein [Halomonas sabkhae]MDN3525452.1 DUF1285 domain-containing protein [Halomonas sabkhae]